MLVVTLLTDFGAGSGYPAQVKGVLLGRLPRVHLVDISHEVPPFDVLWGALLLEACVPSFPDDAVHLAVVDPGVGTKRRAIALADPAGRRFVAPDNGLLTPFLLEGARIHEIRPGGALPVPKSATFHGRDLLAPAAALLAEGLDVSGLGPAVTDPERLAFPGATHRPGVVEGVTLTADRFGNLLTSIRDPDLRDERVLAATVADREVRFVTTFGDGERGELVLYVGSGGRIEVAVREGSAAEELGKVRGHRVELILAKR